MKCDAYHTRTKITYLDPETVLYLTGKWPENNGKVESEVGECWGTRERDECSCNGDRCKCTFYDYIRNEEDQN